MNDYKDKYGYITRRKIEVPQREDIDNFCKARAIPPEWLVSELIKDID